MSLSLSMYRGRVVRITPNANLDVELDLTLGVLVRKLIIIQECAPLLNSAPIKDVTYCLVILCGGKVINVLTEPTQIDGHLTSRVFVPEWLHAPVPKVVPIEGYPPMVEVGPMVAWMAENKFDPKALRSALRT